MRQELSERFNNAIKVRIYLVYLFAIIIASQFSS
jgi:hypothetical protein